MRIVPSFPLLRFTTGLVASGLLIGCGDGSGASDNGPTESGTGGATAGTGGTSPGPGGAPSGTGGDAPGAGGTSVGTGGGSVGSGTGADPDVSLPAIALTDGCAALPNLPSSTVHEVNSDEQSDFVTALDAAVAGDVILLKQNVPDTYLKIDGYDFDPENPVWVIADSGVTVHSLTIQYSSGINIAGFDFESTEGYTLLKLSAAQNINVVRNTFDLSKVVGHGQSAIIVSGYDEPTIENSDTIEIGCNHFANIDFAPADSGSFIKVQYDNGLIPTDLHIHHNHFANIAPIADSDGFQGDSDREAIVFGDSDSQDVEANYLVEFNLFEDCDGENEIITVKTSNNTIRHNTIRHNTFKNSLGSVSVRFGQQTHVYGNYFFADGDNQNPYPNDTGGIRLYGSKHLIFNNCFEGLTGTGYRMPILVDSGDATDSSGGNGHERSSEMHILNNTIVDCTSGLGVGSDNYSIKPNSNTIANNLLVNTESTLMVVSNPINTLYANNMGFGADPGGSFTEAQLSITAASPLLTDGTVSRLFDDSSAVDAASTDFETIVADDIEGHARSTPDVGADELSDDTAKRGPLTPSDVGPDAPVASP